MPAHSRDRFVIPAHQWLLALVPAMALVVVAAGGLWHLRNTAVAGQARELTLLSLALTDEISRGLQSVQEGLQAMRAELRQGRLPLNGPQAERALKTRAELLPLVRKLWLTDAQGRVLQRSGESAPPPASSFLPALDKLDGASAAIGSPFTDPATGAPQIAMAIPFSSPGGAPGGWILAAMPADALLGAFSAVSPSADARMAVFRDDGVRLAGSIVQFPRLDSAQLASRLADRKGIETARLSDGSDRLVATRDVARFGLKVVMTRNLQAVLAAWRQAALLTAAGIALLAMVVVGSALLVRRADRHRERAQRALQSQISRASKLEALGTLAGGVSHDFNNVLAAIVGFGEMAQDAAPKGSDQERHIGKVLQAALRGRTLVERILAFSRGGANASRVFEMQPIVEEVLALMNASLRSGVVLEKMLAAPSLRLRGDPAQAFEAVMNLCTNAMQAMPDGGRLTVQLAPAHAGAARILSHSRLPAGDYLELTVQDEGAGMGADVMEHLFEPFFSTRREQSGTGLGLSVVHGVVAEFGGAIDVQSAPGIGSVFRLYFPESRELADLATPVPRPAHRGAGQPVLVVDDEPSLVAMTTEMLSGLGYAPAGFTDPAAALQALRDEPDRFVAVITDEVMPEMTGTSLTARLRTVLPDLPVLLVTGYGGMLLASRATEAGVTRLLNKPLQRAELAHTLEDVLR